MNRVDHYWEMVSPDIRAFTRQEGADGASARGRVGSTDKKRDARLTLATHHQREQSL